MKKAILLGVLLGGLSGCSSIVSKSEYSVAIASNPGDAQFTVVNKAGEEVHRGVTPATVTLKSSSGYFKREQYEVTFLKEGYADRTFTLTSTVDGWYYGNILLGGLIGMLIVDPATGAMYNLPKRLEVSLDEQVSQVQSKDITIASIESLTESEKARLVDVGIAE